jgi:hypothetical protein
LGIIRIQGADSGHTEVKTGFSQGRYPDKDNGPFVFSNAARAKGRFTAMELMQLEIFVAIVEEGSMTNAGRRVFRTQPAVSLSLRNLENELGVPLICRPRKYPLVLTPAGVLLHHYAKCLLTLRDNARAAVKTCGQTVKADARSRNTELPPLLSVSYGQRGRSGED